MEFYKNFQELIDSKILSQKGLDELKMHLEFDGFDIEPDGVELRSFKDNYDVIECFSPNLFNALKKEQAFSCFEVQPASKAIATISRNNFLFCMFLPSAFAYGITSGKVQTTSVFIIGDRYSKKWLTVLFTNAVIATATGIFTFNCGFNGSVWIHALFDISFTVFGIRR